MPPLRFKPNAFYSREGMPDFEDLMRRAHQSEFDAIQVVDATGQETMLFSRSSEDDGDLLPTAMAEGVISLAGIAIGNRIIQDGVDIR